MSSSRPKGPILWQRKLRSSTWKGWRNIWIRTQRKRRAILAITLDRWTFHQNAQSLNQYCRRVKCRSVLDSEFLRKLRTINGLLGQVERSWEAISIRFQLEGLSMRWINTSPVTRPQNQHRRFSILIRAWAFKIMIYYRYTNQEQQEQEPGRFIIGEIQRFSLFWAWRLIRCRPWTLISPSELQALQLLEPIGTILLHHSVFTDSRKMVFEVRWWLRARENQVVHSKYRRCEEKMETRGRCQNRRAK